MKASLVQLFEMLLRSLGKSARYQPISKRPAASLNHKSRLKLRQIPALFQNLTTGWSDRARLARRTTEKPQKRPPSAAIFLVKRLIRAIRLPNRSFPATVSKREEERLRLEEERRTMEKMVEEKLTTGNFAPGEILMSALTMQFPDDRDP